MILRHFFRDVPANIRNNSDTLTTNTYNILKTAINRGTELIKGTFLKGSTVPTDSIDSKAIPINQIKNEIHETESDNESTSSESSSSSESVCSSPDSIMTELMYFKPIAREPRTPSVGTINILRLPSVRSTSSSSTTIQTPCSSPFFIPISSKRRSAFSLVVHNNTTEIDDNHTGTRKKPKKVKRKTSLTGENKKPDDKSPPKRRRCDRKTNTDIIKDSDSSRRNVKTEKLAKETTKEPRGTKTRLQTKVPTTTTKQKGLKDTAKQAAVRNETKSSDNEYRRVTRSMKN